MRLLPYLVAVSLSAQWLPQRSPTTVSLRGVSAVSERIAWASGANGTFLRTVDGGATWLAGVVPGAERLDFRDVQAFDAGRAYLASSGPGRQSRIYRTLDGGAHWDLLFENADDMGFFDALAFWDFDRGLVLGDPVDGRFVVLRTTDAGAHWERVTGLPPARDGEGAFAASGTCLVVGPNGMAWFGTGGPTGARVFRSTGWGRSWTAAQTPIRHDSAASGIFSLSFRDALHGIAVGGNYQQPGEDRANVAVTSDGGKTWWAPGSRPAGYRSAVVWLRNGRALATGPGGADASRDGGRTWSPTSNRGYHAMSFASARTGWAVGSDGRIARSQ